MANCISNPPTTRKNGPWGANVGTEKDVIVEPQRLESITIRYGWVIDSVEFSYIGTDGKRHTQGPWGGYGGNREKKICLGPKEFITEVSGTTGTYEDYLVVRTLKFVTNKGTTHGPFGRDPKDGKVTPFCSRGTVIGFHGYCGDDDYLNSIGTYTKSLPTRNRNGPWGGCGGFPKDITVGPQRLERITIHSGWTIDSLEFSYIGEDGQRYNAGPWGGPGGDQKTIYLGPSEFITEVSGTTGTYEGYVVVRSLKFVTNMGTTHGPFGREQNNPFSIQGTVVGFHGRCGKYLDSIGTYTV